MMPLPNLQHHRQQGNTLYAVVLLVGLFILVGGAMRFTQLEYGAFNLLAITPSMQQKNTTTVMRVQNTTNQTNLPLSPLQVRTEPNKSCTSNRGCPWSFICVDGLCIKGCETIHDCVEPQYCGKNGKCMVRYPSWYPGGDMICLDHREPCYRHVECCSGWCRIISHHQGDWEFECAMRPSP